MDLRYAVCVVAVAVRLCAVCAGACVRRQGVLRDGGIDVRRGALSGVVAEAEATRLIYNLFPMFPSWTFTQWAALLGAVVLAAAAAVRWVRLGRGASDDDPTLRTLRRRVCLWQLLFALVTILAVLK